MNENSFFNNLDKDLVIEQHKQNTEIILKNPGKVRIQEKDFTDIFSDESINRDLAMVERFEEKFENQLEHLSRADIEKIHDGEKRSEILEIIIASDGERYQWMGKNTRSNLTSRFDDIVNGVDVIYEFMGDNEVANEDNIDRIALGIDASRNSDVYALEKKLEKNVKKIMNLDKQKLPEVKYFQSAINKDFRGKLTTIIPVIIGLDSDHVNELMQLCAVARTLSDPKVFENLKNLDLDPEKRQTKLTEQLLKHPAQVVFYRQVVTQLNYYLKLLKDKNDPNSELHRNEINSILNKVQKIKEEKKDISITNYSNDKVLETIERITT